MPLHIKLIRHNSALVKENQIKRFHDPLLVDQILAKDKQWRSLVTQINVSNKEKKIGQSQVNQKMKEFKKSTDPDKQMPTQLILQVKLLADKNAALCRERDNLYLEIANDLTKIGSILQSDVPFFEDEKDNKVITTWGDELKIKIKDPLPHHKLLLKLGAVDYERGSRVMGHRGYYLTGVGVEMQRALVNYALDFLKTKEYTWIQPPVMMRQDVMGKVAELTDFHETLYRIDIDAEAETDKSKINTNMYLIATSEQPLAVYHEGETLKKNKLPIKYAGYSNCFRREAGKHGKDTWGIFRVHQFEKVEQFVIASPDESNKIQSEMLQVAENFYQSLGLPYQVVNIVSGGLNLAASQKYDLEAWFPNQNTYRELVSCSNCTDYQSNLLNIKIKPSVFDETLKTHQKYVHLLNSTLCATTRTMSCWVENYQTDTGIKVPPILQSYMGGKDFLPFPVDNKITI